MRMMMPLSHLPFLYPPPQHHRTPPNLHLHPPQPTPSSISGTSTSGGPSSFRPPPTASMARSSEPVPEWCKCGLCRRMSQEVENRCCNSRDCVSLSARFRKLCLDPDYLQLSIKCSGDIRNDCQDNSIRAFRKAAYRHDIIEEYGYLGKHKRRVCPSCCVWKIQEHYPSSTGVYMGFKPCKNGNNFLIGFYKEFLIAVGLFNLMPYPQPHPPQKKVVLD